MVYFGSEYRYVELSNLVVFKVQVESVFPEPAVICKLMLQRGAAPRGYSNQKQENPADAVYGVVHSGYSLLKKGKPNKHTLLVWHKNEIKLMKYTTLY
jgi:hypothetical protein